MGELTSTDAGPGRIRSQTHVSISRGCAVVSDLRGSGGHPDNVRRVVGWAVVSRGERGGRGSRSTCESAFDVPCPVARAGPWQHERRSIRSRVLLITWSYGHCAWRRGYNYCRGESQDLSLKARILAEPNIFLRVALRLSERRG